MMEGMSDDRDA
ncbi:Protein of unknown function [Thermobacillus xylanilyticus]|uniref:Uncharacterized protein n=1 Tax=Thermobacillus xylanilyticus TaxID=76633 RepID=A0ABN7S5X4_THEXY|nr:Protein of unknown function [Thermobacillus xylanilyticus]